MKFIKKNLLLIILAIVVLCSLVVLVYPLSKWSHRLRSRMRTSLSMVGVAKSLSRMQINIPGLKVFTGPITPEIINRKRQVQKLMHGQSREIVAMAGKLNSLGRVIFPDGPKGEVVPLLAGKPEQRLLPRPNQSLVRQGNFKRDYRRLFLPADRNPRGWLARLDAAMPPSKEQIRRLVRQRLEQLHLSMPQSMVANQANDQKSRIIEQVTRHAIFQTAEHCRIYASPACFQERDFIESPTVVPSAMDIYDAFVDTWLQNDVVNAIIQTNHGSVNVAESPIKQLLYVRVGSGASPGAVTNSGHLMPTMLGRGGLFVSEGAASAPTNTGIYPAQNYPGAPPNGPGAPNGPGGYPPAGFSGNYPGAAPSVAATGSNYTESMTGHIGSSIYEVIKVRVGLILEPSKLNDFINNLYRQNNGYTVLNVQIKTVDPITAISYGFVYGPVSVIEADMTIEELMFNEWNGRVMPKAYRQKFGIVIPAAGVNGPGQ